MWTWTAICADTKLVPSWQVGERNLGDCWTFIEDLKGRMRGRIQLSTDGLAAYQGPSAMIFGGDIDWAQQSRNTGRSSSASAATARPSASGHARKSRLGYPDPTRISTSYVERQNLTMRMSMRRFTRLTNAFSKKVENHAAAVAIHFMHYNFARPHKTLANPYPRTPAMAAGVADHIWTLREIVALLDRPTVVH